ncbi:hypothetical protein [Paraburkholderia pallida]|uniref:Uncharacterized protein n=1 Tax=Paraburkholderia pallida TaxID=2547399 RepID=A0A4P7DCH2_9BURK|nr:hypothetical protein [Paraburkholderia pallida]QBR04402.1 hypothetical protein E1956_45805 [Paraburkholderia pallida]
MFRATIVDPEGFWTKPLSMLPSCGDKVHWSMSPTEPPAREADLCFQLAGKLNEPGSQPPDHTARITVLVDTSLPLGHRDCGAVLVCAHSTMHEAIAAAAGALFTVATANHVVRFQWAELLDVLSCDTLMVASKAGSADHDSITRCALQNLGYFQGASRVEPEATLLGIAVPQVRPPRLRDMVKVASSLRALVGQRCYQLIGYRLTSGPDEDAFLLATFPIPALPGGAVRAAEVASMNIDAYPPRTRRRSG